MTSRDELDPEETILAKTIALSRLSGALSSFADCFGSPESDQETSLWVNSVAIHNRSPHLVLLLPVQRFGDWSDVLLQDPVAALRRSRQIEDLLLDVGALGCQAT